MPATPTGANYWPRAAQAVLGGQSPDGVLAGGTVDVQHIKGVAGGQADVGLGVARPPSQDPGPVTGGVLDPMRHQAAQRVLGDLAAAWIPTRAARLHLRLPVAGDWPEVAAVGEGVVQGQHRNAAGGIA
jgi:hypothetical protein